MRARPASFLPIMFNFVNCYRIITLLNCYKTKTSEDIYYPSLRAVTFLAQNVNGSCETRRCNILHEHAFSIAAYVTLKNVSSRHVLVQTHRLE